MFETGCAEETHKLMMTFRFKRELSNFRQI